MFYSPGQNPAVGSLSLLQGIFPTQGSNPGLLHYRWILYQLSHQGSPLQKLLEHIFVTCLSPWIVLVLYSYFCSIYLQTVLFSLLCRKHSPMPTCSRGSVNVFLNEWNPCWASLVAQLIKNPPAMQETWVRSLGWEDPLENGKASPSSILAWRIPWTI